jgi:CRP-like cAMP-binding protein
MADRVGSARIRWSEDSDSARNLTVRSISRYPVAPSVPVFGAKAKAESRRMLEKVPIFSSLTERQINRLAQGLLEKDFTVGTTVVKQGEKGIGFYLILDGGVEVRRRGRKLATLGPGDFFGEMALFENEARTADVVATKPTKCAVLSVWEFWGYAMSQPKMLRGMLAEMAHRLSETNRALTE